MAAFGSGAMSVFATTSYLMRSEGEALWLLFSSPCALGPTLLRKFVICVPVAWLCAFGVLAFSRAQIRDLEASAWIVFAFCTLAVYGVMCSASGVLRIRAVEPTNWSRFTDLSVCILLAVPCVGVFAGPSPWVALPYLFFTAAMAWALWLRARRTLPYLLDPVAAPLPMLDVVDGLSCAWALGFCVALLLPIASLRLGLPAGPSLAVAYAIATTLLMYGVWQVGRLRGLSSPIAALGLCLSNRRAWLIAWRASAVWSLPAMLVAGGFAQLVLHWPWLRQLTLTQGGAVGAFNAGEHGLSTLLIAVCAAPIGEEVVHRGIIYRALRSDFGVLGSALASAALFAAFHPPYAMLPVFALGVCAALALERSGLLWASIGVHGVYNACLLYLMSR
jgi:membrane protease YdiL (CAAX protease family)